LHLDARDGGKAWRVGWHGLICPLEKSPERTDRMTALNVTASLARHLLPRPVRNLVRSPRVTARWLGRKALYRLGHRPIWKVRPDWSPRYHPSAVDTFAAIDKDEDFRAELDGFVAHCTPGMHFIDIGSHYGFYTLVALHFGGPSSRAVAVDPSHELNRVHRLQLALNGAARRAEVIEAAVGAEDGRLKMLSTGPFGDHFLLRSDRPDADSVPVYTLGSLITLTGLIPSHLKIDVEGYEDEVLSGGLPMLREHRPTIFLELHCGPMRAMGRHPEEVLSLLEDAGYHRFEWRGQPITPDQILALDIARLVCLPG
jgi:FkbM family methyltransferase